MSIIPSNVQQPVDIRSSQPFQSSHPNPTSIYQQQSTKTIKIQWNNCPSQLFPRNTRSSDHWLKYHHSSTWKVESYPSPIPIIPVISRAHEALIHQQETIRPNLNHPFLESPGLWCLESPYLRQVQVPWFYPQLGHGSFHSSSPNFPHQICHSTRPKLKRSTPPILAISGPEVIKARSREQLKTVTKKQASVARTLEAIGMPMISPKISGRWIL